MKTPLPTRVPPPPLSPEQAARLRAALAAELDAPVRPWWGDAVRLGAAMLAVFVAGSVLVNQGRSPLDAPGASLAQALALVVVAVVAGVSALAPWPQRTARNLAIGALLVGTVGFTQLASTEGTAFSPYAGCLVFEVLGAVVPAAVAIVAVRRQAPRLSRAVLLGLAAGTASMAALELKCPHRDVGHLLVFHLAPLALIAAATVFVRRRLSTTSYAP